MNGYESALLENIERINIKLSRLADNLNYIDPMGYKNYSSLLDLINHQSTLIQETKKVKDG